MFSFMNIHSLLDPKYEEMDSGRTVRADPQRTASTLLSSDQIQAAAPWGLRLILSEGHKGLGHRSHMVFTIPEWQSG